MLAFAFWAGLSSSAAPTLLQSAPPPELIADLELAENEAPPLNTSLHPVFELGGEVYFSASISINGIGLADSQDLWVTDGTPAGTRQVNDFTGIPSLVTTPPIAAAELPGDRYVFSAASKEFGTELFLFDPNVSGTPLVADLATGNANADPTALTAWRGYVWFLAADAAGRRNLWRTDGTASGTVLDPITAFPELELFAGDTQLAVADDRLFVTTNVFGESLFLKPDPGAPGVPLAAFGSGTFGATTGAFEDLAVVGPRLVFIGSTAPAGTELWVSDGSLGGTSMLANLAPGSADSNPVFYGSDGARLWFHATTPTTGREIWVTDGTAAGTSLALETVAGNGSSVVKAATRGLPFGGGLLFTASGATGTDVCFLDGSSGATTLLVSTPGTGVGGGYGFTESAGRAYFFTDSGFGGSATTSLWVTDGTVAGTQFVDSGPLGEDFASTGLGTTPQGFVFGGVGPEGLELRSTSGTPGTTTLVANLSADALTIGSAPSNPSRLRDGVAFSAETAATGRELYFSDGTSPGTVALRDLSPLGGDSNPHALGVVGDRLLFAASSPGIGRELWRTDGTPAGTELVLDLFPGPAGAFAEDDDSAPAVLDGVAYFFATDATGRGLWRSDGTAAGTFLVKSIPNPTGSPHFLVAADSRLFFRAPTAATGIELWVSDGTTAGTLLAADLKPGPSGSGLMGLTPLGERVLFSYSGPEGQQLGVSDGTVAGSIPLGGGAGGLSIGSPEQITIVGDLAVFSGVAPGLGRELGVTDGTAAGTALLLDLEPGPAGANPLEITAAGGRAFFFASVTEGSTFKQNRLWVTDGTVAGTRIVADAPGGGVQFQAERIVPVGSDGKVIFAANDLEHGREPWISDGTEAGTRLLADIAPGPQASDLIWAQGSGNRVLLAASDQTTGQELFAFDLALAETWLLEPFGDSCGAEFAGSGTAQLGGVATLELSSPTPTASTFLFFSRNQAWIQFGGGCTQYLADPGLLAVGATDAQGLLSESLDVPVIPAVIGLELYFQVLIEAPGGPLLGAFELSNALEAVIGG